VSTGENPAGDWLPAPLSTFPQPLPRLIIFEIERQKRKKGTTPVRIRAQRDDLADVLARANRAVASRTARPVLQGLLCEVSGSRLRVTGTDEEITIQTEMEVEALEEGQTVVPGRLLSEAVRKMPAGMVTLGATGTEVAIQGNGPRFSPRPLNVHEFPLQPETTDEGVEIDGEMFTEAINQVTVAASMDSARPILTGVLFDSSDQGLRMVATDSYRLAKRELPGVQIDGSGLVPARGLRALPRPRGTAAGLALGGMLPGQRTTRGARLLRLRPLGLHDRRRQRRLGDVERQAGNAQRRHGFRRQRGSLHIGAQGCRADQLETGLG